LPPFIVHAESLLREGSDALANDAAETGGSEPVSKRAARVIVRMRRSMLNLQEETLFVSDCA
jgi:hypothetical protein